MNALAAFLSKICDKWNSGNYMSLLKFTTSVNGDRQIVQRIDRNIRRNEDLLRARQEERKAGR